MQTARQNADKKLKAELFRYKLKTSLYYAVAANVLLICVIKLVLYTLRLSAKYDADVASAPEQTAMAVVVSKNAAYSKTDVFFHYQFRLNNRVVSTGDGNSERSVFTNVGDVVPVTYRIDKSGAYYIESWQAPPRKVELPH